MISSKALRLPLPKELKSNKLEDIQKYLTNYTNELDRQYRRLWQDVAVIQWDSDGFLYFGNKKTDGSWRIGRRGVNWSLEHRASGAWTIVDEALGA